MWDKLGQKRKIVVMANKRRDNSAGTKIRHYVYAQLRNNGDQSVALPSSYELAEMFETTRRVARYELELLIAQGVLISKPRIGTFTNPRMNYINATPIQKKMPLIGIIDGDGQRFCYGCAENLIYCHLGLALTAAKCYVHHIAFSCLDDDSRIRELKALGLDGIIWHKSSAAGFPSDEFLSKVEEAGIPVVAVVHSSADFGHRVELSTAEAEEELARIFREEQRKEIEVLSNLSLEYDITARMVRQMGITGAFVNALDPALTFSDRIRQFTEQLGAGYRPDLLVCDPMFAETVPDLLAAAGIDLERECRLVACNELNSEENFRGFIIAPDAARTARAAVEMLLDIRGGKPGCSARIIPCGLREINDK